jgi:uncharacterized protein involved in propanediol utilization
MPESEKAASAKLMLAEIRELMDAAETSSEWKGLGEAASASATSDQPRYRA